MPQTRGRATGGMGVEGQGTRNAESQTWKLPEAGEPDTWKLVRPVCAVRRFEISLSQTGRTREVFVSHQLTQRRKPNGTRACWWSGACLKAL